MKVIFVIITIIYAHSLMFASDEIYDLKMAHKFDINTSIILIDIDCIDENNCVLLHTDNKGNGIVCEKTTNGGISWETTFADSSTKEPEYFAYNLARRCKYFPDGTVILLGDHGKLLRSEDFGETFIEFYIENYGYSDFEMLDNKRAVTTSIKIDGSPDTEFGIYKSSDGCKTWQNFNIPDSISAKFNFYQIIVQKNNNLILSCTAKYPIILDSTKRYYYKTDFEGNYWEPITTPRYIDKFHYINENDVVGVGKKQKTIQTEKDTAFIAKSYDGGKTWEIKMKTIPPFHGFNYCEYYYDSLLIIYGRGFGFFKTTDIGESWYLPVFHFDSSITDLILATTNASLFNNGNFYLMTTWPGQVIKGTKINTSIDLPSVKPKKIYPNPVSSGSTFTSEYEIERSGFLRIYLSDVSGKEISMLYSGFSEAGSYSTALRLSDNISSGSYWLVLEQNGYQHVQMLNVVK